MPAVLHWFHQLTPSNKLSKSGFSQMLFTPGGDSIKENNPSCASNIRDVLTVTLKGVKHLIKFHAMTWD